MNKVQADYVEVKERYDAIVAQEPIDMDELIRAEDALLDAEEQLKDWVKSAVLKLGDDRLTAEDIDKIYYSKPSEFLKLALRLE